ncbi:uncharacterized protein N7459_002709 [Penicillium hispanicum]|uniref:uncharacterized protein n=1 Tax=Penicillium hispanicum TaxID=1080232 RepID=UPI00253FC44D|nr:uncharacterized protein N7459_002709 [Penicillium hispanicum]KAJ5586944.1 hypothetical protein N7459_002709 [Penicillium hispanicum]
MPLLALPNELLFCIASHLETQSRDSHRQSQRDLNALPRVNRRCYSLFNPRLYAYNIAKFPDNGWRGGLRWACKHGQLQTVLKFLEQGANFLASKDNYYPLVLAVDHGHVAIVNLLIGLMSKSDLEARSENLMTRAIYGNHIAIVKTFADLLFADPALLGDGGFDFICSATYHLNQGDDTILRFLLDRGFGSSTNVDSLEWHLKAHLTRAARSGREESVRFMLHRGIDVNFCCEEECFAPLSSAIIANKPAVAKLLLECGANPYIKPCGEWWGGYMPLYLAALLGRAEAVEALLDHGVHPDGLDRDGNLPQVEPEDEFFEQMYAAQLYNLKDSAEGINCESNCCIPLCAASMMGKEDAVRILLGRGADPNRPDPNGDVALVLAAKRGHEGTVKALIESGANVDTADSGGWTALDRAWGWGGIHATIALLEAGADHSPVRFEDEDLILKALLYGHTNGLSLLPDKIIDDEEDFRKHRNSWLHGEWYCGQNFHEGESHDCEDLVKCLLDRGSDIEAQNSLGRTALHIAAFQRCVNTVELLLKRGANPNAKDAFDQTPLHMAGGWNSKSVSLLLQYGADPNFKDCNADAPLHLAIRTGSYDMVDCLAKDKRTDVDSKNQDGDTALHLALSSPDLSEPEVRTTMRAVQRLCEAGANPNMMDKNGDRPLDLARKKDLESLVQLFSSESAEVDIHSLDLGS